MNDGYDYWRKRLRGHALPIDPAIPQPGCWRVKQGARFIPVLTWQKIDATTGEFVAFASKAGKPIHPREVWPACADYPVSSTAYKLAMDGKPWPDDVASASAIPEGGNFQGLPEHEKIYESIIDIEAAAIAWFESIGEKLSRQEHADKAANYAQRFADLFIASESAYKKGRLPHRLALDEIDKRWKPVLNKAEDCRITIKQEWLKPWLAAQRAAQKAAAIEEIKDPATVVHSPKAGTDGRRTHTRVVKTAHMYDARAFLQWLVTLEDLSPYLLSAAQKIANKMIFAGKENIPGVEPKEDLIVC